jgi:pentatricopeptide repeat protein
VPDALLLPFRPGQGKKMQLAIRSNFARRSLMFLEVLLFLAVVGWIAKTYIADVLASEPTVKNLELAVKLDPANAEYHRRLARLYQYDIANVQPEKALEHLRQAVQLNPYDPQAWLELAAAVEFQGKTSEAEQYLRRADFLAPNIPAYQWPIANFCLLQGNVDEAFRHFKVVLAGTAQYDQNLFTIAWKASGEPDKILDQLIPNSIPTEFRYLYYLLSQQRFAEARPVWKRIMSNPQKFTPQEGAGYIDSLLTTGRPEEAYQVWRDLQGRGLIPNPATGTPENLLTNGDFEDGLLNMGFSWRIVSVEGIYAGLDTTTYHSPSHALLVQFSGKQNVDYRHVFQYVKVAPRHAYRLEAFMKSEGITTDSGPRLEIRDAYNTAALYKLSEDLTGRTNGWTSVLLDFTTGPRTELLVVALRRAPSRKLDNLIAGKVWLDDVRLTPLSK